MKSNFLVMYHEALMALAFQYSLVFVAIVADLLSGIRKARARNEVRSSFGLRRTVDKIIKYYNMLIVITVIDAVVISSHVYRIFLHIPMMPYFTALGVGFLCFVELKSIYEKSADKDKARYEDARKTLVELLKNKDELLTLININKPEEDETSS